MARINALCILALGLLLLATVCVSQNAPFTFSSTGQFLQPGWNLIALPGTPLDPNPAVVLAGTSFPNSSVQFWDNSRHGGGFRNFGLDWDGPMEPGVGYWVNESEPAKDIQFTGFENLSDWTIEIPGRNGSHLWIMFGHPFAYPTPCSKIRFSTPGHPEPMDWVSASDARIIQHKGSAFDQFRHAYVDVGPNAEATELEPWHGYWLMVDTDEPITIHIPAVVPKVESVRFTGGVPLYDPVTDQTSGITEAPPQWQNGSSGNTPAAYVQGTKAVIEVQAVGIGPAECGARIRKIRASLVGESAEGWPCETTFDTPSTSVTFQTAPLPSGLAPHQVELQSYCDISYDGTSWYPVQTPIITQHLVYTLLASPTAPMDYDSSSGSKHKGAWIPLIETACRWAGSTTSEGTWTPATNPSTALMNICMKVNHGDFLAKVPDSDPLQTVAAKGLFHYLGIWETDFAGQQFGVFEPFANGGPLFDEGTENPGLTFPEGEGSASIVEAAEGNPAFSGTHYYQVTGTEVSNPDVWDFSLQDYPYFGWTWKKQGGTHCELRLRFRNEDTGDTRWIRYWQGSEPSPCDDPGIRVNIYSGIPQDWQTMFRNLQEDVAKLLEWPRDKTHLVGIALRPWDGENASFDSILLGAGNHRLYYDLAGYLAASSEPPSNPGKKPKYFHYQLRGECDDVNQLTLCLGTSVGLNLKIAQIDSASGSGFWQKDISPVGWDACSELGHESILHPNWTHDSWVENSRWKLPWGTFQRSLWHQAIFSLDDNRIYDAALSMRDPENPDTHRYPLGLPFLGGTADDYEGWISDADFVPTSGLRSPNPAWLFCYGISTLELK